MPGINPDPAESMNVADVIAEFFRKDVPAIVTKVQRDIVKAQSSLSAAGFARGIAPNVPVLLMAADQSRTRMLLRASVPDIFIGTMSELQSGSGYQLPTQAGDEVKTVSDVYAVYTPSAAPDATARIFVWAERNSG
jgi:hypothetical protein